MNALIIDDEQKAREVLQLQLEYHVPEVKVIRQAHSADEASTLLLQFKPNIVFLDIKMPGKDGFAWLKSLDEYDFQIIFTTAYDQFAIKAIRFAAFDYLLKPVDAEELCAAMDRLLQEKTRQQKSLENLFYNAEQIDPYNYRLTIPTTEGTHYLDPAQIMHCEADGNYTHFFMEGGRRIVASRPLGHYLELLEGFDFIRCHKSHLVHVPFVKKYGEQGLTLLNGTIVEVSRRRRADVKRQLTDYVSMYRVKSDQRNREDPS